MASISETYVHWLEQMGYDDAFIRLCINNGVPMRTSAAIDQSVMKLLQAAGIQPDVPANVDEQEQAAFQSRKIWDVQRHNEYDYVRSMLVDTGATGSLNWVDLEWALTNSRPSQYKIAVAKGDTTMNGSRDGRLNVQVLNTASQRGIGYSTPFSFDTTTVRGLRTELLSLDAPYRHGRWNVMLRQPDYDSGINELYRAAGDGMPEARIPIRYDYAGPGGWWLDYVIEGSSYTHQALLERHYEDSIQANNADIAAELMRHTYGEAAAEEVFNQISSHDSVKWTVIANTADVTVIQARHPDERQIKGVKAGLKRGKQKMPIMVFHKGHGHIGNVDDACEICRMIKGAMRRITKKVDPYKETRVGYMWSMDMVTFSHRSLEGSKYAINLRDKASGVIKIIPCYLKSDAPAMVEQWINSMRADPAFQDLPYKVASAIQTDEPGEWSRRSAKWVAMQLRVKSLETIYVTPETSKEAGHAEKTNCIVEECIKAILFEMDLSPAHWQAAARNAEFLLNRFPNLATDNTASIDGDQPRPLEILYRGAYSRRQIDRELSYFVQVGTPALVHCPRVKGSQLQPKVRWGIAWGMYREQVVWLCPFTKSTFRSKSFTAFELKDRMNYADFLGLPAMTSSRKSMDMQGDEREKVTIKLTELKHAGKAGKPPVVKLQCTTNAGVQTINIPAQTELDEAAEKEAGQMKRESYKRGSKRPAVDGPNYELGGSIQYENADRQLIADPITDELQEDQTKSGQLPGAEWDQDQSGMVLDSPSGLEQPGECIDTYWDRSPEMINQAPLNSSAISSLEDGQQVQQLSDDVEAGQQPDKAEFNAEQHDHTDDYTNIFGDYDEESDYDENDEEDQDKLDTIAQLMAEREAITTGINLSFDKLCKQNNVPHELHNLYHTWLMQLTNNGKARFNEHDIPLERYIEQGKNKFRAYAKPGLKVPAPHGKMWRRMMKDKNMKYAKFDKQRIIQANHMVREAILNTVEGIKAVEAITKHRQRKD